MNARALGLENVSVVQGTLLGTGAIEGYRFGHSWVEADIPGSDTRVVLDYSSGASLVTDRDTYRFTQQAQDVHEYGVSQARRLASSGNYGPVDRRCPGRLARLTSHDVSPSARWDNRLRALRRHPRRDRQHAARRHAPHVAEARRAPVGQARGQQPHRLHEGPHRQEDDRGRRGLGRAHPRPDDPRADVGQHRHLARDGRRPQGLPPDRRDPRQRQSGARRAAPAVRRRDRLQRGRPGHERLDRGGAPAGAGPQVLHAVPVRQRRRTRSRTTRGRPRRSSRTCRRSRTSWRAWARAARSPATAAGCTSTTRTSR